jgi:hypothetical protein
MFATFILLLFYRYDRVTNSLWIRYPEILLGEGYNWLRNTNRYTDWIFNIVPVEKEGTGKIRVCIDFHNLNRANTKDEYPMHIANMIVNDSSGHKVICFLDGNARYNQIFMAEEDMHKMDFRCPSFVGLFEWVVMTFCLKMPGQLIKGQ